MNPSYHFGAGELARLPEILPPGKKVMLVTGRSVSATPQVRDLIASMGSRIVCCVTADHGEPTLDSVRGIVRKGRDTGAECLAAIGGGSVMDAGKAAAAMIPAEDDIAEYFYGRKPVPGKGLFFAAVPTTAGTGAESTNNAVLIDTETKIKQSLRHTEMIPDAAIVDPVLLLNCPPRVTAASGMDAFVQSFEGFMSPKATPETREKAGEAVRLIYRNLGKACLHPEDLEAKTSLAYASMISGQAFASTGLGAIHGLAHPAGALFGIPHGIACAIFMKPVLAFNEPVRRDDYRLLAGLMGTEDFAESAVSLAARLGIPSSLHGYGLKESDFPFIVKNCRSGSMKNNPRPLSDEDVIAILRGLL